MYKKIIVPIDGSYTSSLALDEAIKLGKQLGSKIDVAHVAHTLGNAQIPVIDPSANAYQQWVESGKSVLDFAQQQLQEAGLTGDMLLIEYLDSRDKIGTAILDAARKQQAELIIIGSHGLSGYKEHTLGSVAKTLINQEEFPVWLIRGKHAETA